MTKTVNYTYDNFNRLKTAATRGAHWGLSWSYNPPPPRLRRADRYGNRLSQTATKGTPPSNSLSISTATNRVNAWTYDAAGNTLADGASELSHTYTYDANNMIKTVDGGAVQYKYDAGGGRVMKVAAAETTYYAYGSEYSSVSGWRRVFVEAGGIKVEYRDNQTYFHQRDRLGTPRVQTDSAGNLVETWSYYPFGEQWEQAGSGGNEHRFTGHRRDPETGNDYAGARYFKGPNGRWLTVDPSVGSMSHPQRLNRYAYVLNGPTQFFDPDGRDPEEGGQGGEQPPKEPINIGDGGSVTVTAAAEEQGTLPALITGVGAGGGSGVFIPLQNEERHPVGLPSIGLPSFESSIADAKINTVLIATMNSDCRMFLESVISKLADFKGLKGADRSSYTLERLLNGVRAASVYNGGSDITPIPGLSGGAAQHFFEHPDKDAVVFPYPGYLDRIYFRDQASLQMTGLFLHEAFHVSTFDGTMSGGFYATDEALARAVNQGGAKDPSAAFSKEINAHCTN